MDNIEKLDSIFSQYIRLRDSKIYGFRMFRCISCGIVLPFVEADCGHFIKRSHMATRFDEDNCHAQCISCNRFRGGNYDKFRENLEKKIGKEGVEELLRKKHTIVKLSKSDIEDMIKYYRDKIKEFEK